MDLTSLSSNLPRNGPARSSPTPDPSPDDEPSSAILMSAFKSAALSVTTLYKTAAQEAERSQRTGRAEGYNDCLEDVLALLARIEHRVDAKTTEIVKQWALSRRRKSGVRTATARGDDRERDRELSAESECMEPAASSPPPPPPPPPPSMPVFSFRADHAMPQPQEMEDIASPPVSPQLLPRSKGHHHHQPRTGTKRRYGSINDFFELAGLEKFHVGKKGRFQ